MHLIEEHPTKREGIERRGSLRGDGACAGSQLSLPLEFRSHLHHQSLKHPAQRADAGGQVRGQMIGAAVERLIENDLGHDRRHPVDRHEVLTLTAIHAKHLEQGARLHLGAHKRFHERRDDPQRLVESVARVREAVHKITHDNTRAVNGADVEEVGRGRLRLGDDLAAFVVVSRRLADVEFSFENPALPQAAEAVLEDRTTTATRRPAAVRSRSSERPSRPVAPVSRMNESACCMAGSDVDRRTSVDDERLPLDEIGQRTGKKEHRIGDVGSLEYPCGQQVMLQGDPAPSL